MRIPSQLVTAAAIASLCGCSPKKSADKEQPAKPPTPAKAEPESRLGPASKIERTQRPTLARKGPDRTTQSLKLLGGIKVSEEGLSQLYTSRGKVFIGFKAKVKALEQDCLLEWKAELIEGDTGRGTSVSAVSGRLALEANSEQVVSAVVGLSPEQAAMIGSASAGFWTICGEAMPSPSALAVQITETTSEQVKFGSSFKLQHTRVKTKPLAVPAQTRCYFDLVAEDINKAGYTLNRDFARYSLASGKPGSVLLRRTAFEGGGEKDFKDLVAGKRSYARKLHCAGPWDPASASLDGLTVSALSLHRHQGKAESADHFTRASYQHKARLENTTGKNCSFNLRYRLLDTEGIPLASNPVLAETLHLRKGASVDYQAPGHRIFAWLDQEEQVGKLVAERSTPINDCKDFDSDKALD